MVAVELHLRIKQGQSEYVPLELNTNQLIKDLRQEVSKLSKIPADEICKYSIPIFNYILVLYIYILFCFILSKNDIDTLCVNVATDIIHSSSTLPLLQQSLA